MRLMPGAGAMGTVAWRWGRHLLRHPWRDWLIRAAAVIVAVVAVVAIRNSAPPAVSASGGPAGGVPEYYVAMDAGASLEPVFAQDAVVGDTFTGKREATVPAPAGWGFASVTAAGDDRTFLLVAASRSDALEALIPTRWYLLSLTPGAARFATLRMLPIAPLLDVAGYGYSVALSPDGTQFAFMDGPSLRIYSTATDALLHSWSAPVSRSEPDPELVSWIGAGNQLAFQAWAAGALALRLLPVGDPGHDLLAGSRSVLSLMSRPSAYCSGLSGNFLVAGNGKTVVCGSTTQVHEPASDTGSESCPYTFHRYDMAISQVSTVTGKLTGTLHQVADTCPVSSQPVVFWANDDGTQVLGLFNYQVRPGGQPRPAAKNVVQFGLFTAGKFTPLPLPLESSEDGQDLPMLAW